MSAEVRITDRGAGDIAGSPSGVSGELATPWWLFGLLGALWLPAILRWSDEWSVNPQYYYGWSVPLLSAYLLYDRMPERPRQDRPQHRFLAILLMIAFALPQLPLRLVGEANSDWRLISWAMGLGMFGITFCALYLYGGTRWLLFFATPFLFLATAIPWPSEFELMLVQGMMRINAAISAEFVNFCGVPAVARGNVIELPTGLLGVNEACSGIRSLQSTLMASIFLGELYRLKLGGRVLVVAVGIGIAFVLNVVRTSFLSWQGAFHGIESTEKWHDAAGFTILGIVLVCLFGISQFLEKSARGSATAAPPQETR